MIVIVCLIFIIASAGAQSPFGTITFRGNPVDVQSGSERLVVYHTFNIDISSRIEFIGLQYSSSSTIDTADISRQLGCSVGPGFPLQTITTDTEFSATGLTPYGCGGIQFEGRFLDTQKVTLSIVVSYTHVRNSRFWAPIARSGSWSVGTVGEVTIVGSDPKLSLTQRACEGPNRCVSFDVNGYIIGTPNVELVVQCGKLGATRTVKRDNWINQTLIVAVPSSAKYVTCNATYGGVPYVRTRGVPDYDAHLCPCSSGTTLTPCYTCEDCTYRWFQGNRWLSGETTESLSLLRYVSLTKRSRFIAEICDGEIFPNCFNQTFCYSPGAAGTLTSIASMVWITALYPLLQWE